MSTWAGCSELHLALQTGPKKDDCSALHWAERSVCRMVGYWAPGSAATMDAPKVAPRERHLACSKVMHWVQHSVYHWAAYSGGS